jgi:hypothetical protein
MPVASPIRLTDPWIKLGTGGTLQDMKCFAKGIHLVPESDDAAATFCDPFGFQWTLTIDLLMSVGPQSVDEALWALGGPGTVIPWEFAYQNTAASASNPHWTGNARLVAWTVVDAGINETTEINLELTVIGTITRNPAIPYAKGNAQPGMTFPAEATVTAEDATNAAKLAGLGYVANPTTAWTTGQEVTIGIYDFNWSGTAWAAGAHA